MTEILYPIGVDCIWIASDKKNHIGVFITAGIAPIPLDALNNEVILFENIEDSIFNLSKISKSELLISLPRPDDFIDIAERGFFVYDWRDLHRTNEKNSDCYELVAMPTFPLIVDTLPLIISRLSQKVIFKDIEFSNSMNLDIYKFFICSQP